MMEINPLSSYIPGPDKRSKPSRMPVKGEQVQNESYVGPNLEAKRAKLSELEASRENLVVQIQKELASQKFFTEERIKSTIDALLASL